MFQGALHLVNERTLELCFLCTEYPHHLVRVFFVNFSKYKTNGKS